VAHLGGRLIEKQWTNSVFRRLRFLVNLEFAIQVLLTAELIAEVYYGTLYLRTKDSAVRTVAQKILRDEMKHLEFQRQFLGERVATFPPLGRWLWRVQFQAIHKVTAAVVSWDHRHCLRALGMKPPEFRQRASLSWRRFQERLGRVISSAPCEQPPTPSQDHRRHSAPVPARPPLESTPAAWP
jgi:hypothetical protein